MPKQTNNRPLRKLANADEMQGARGAQNRNLLNVGEDTAYRSDASLAAEVEFPKRSNHGLSAKQLDILLNILLPFAKQIESVGLFGSRATGTYRSNSDIDLVLYGSINEKTMDRIFTLLNDSNLPVTVDLQVYNLITYQQLKKHIDANMLPLFTKNDLIEQEQLTFKQTYIENE